MTQPPRRYPRRRRRRDAGILLAIVLLLLGVVLATGGVAIWGLRGDTGAAGRDRLARQLFDCAEQGLAYGKQYFTTTGRGSWTSFYSTQVCATFGCPPFPSNAPNMPVAGGYPSAAPFTQSLNLGTNAMTFTIGIYNNPGDPSGPLTEGSDNSAVVVSKCTDVATGQVRTVQAVISSPLTVTDDYLGQAGRGMRNQGNANNQ